MTVYFKAIINLKGSLVKHALTSTKFTSDPNLSTLSHMVSSPKCEIFSFVSLKYFILEHIHVNQNCPLTSFQVLGQDPKLGHTHRNQFLKTKLLTAPALLLSPQLSYVDVESHDTAQNVTQQWWPRLTRWSQRPRHMRIKWAPAAPGKEQRNFLPDEQSAKVQKKTS